MTNVRTSLYAQGLEGSTHKFRPRWLQTHRQNPNRTCAVLAHCTCLRIEIIPENGISTAFIAGVCDRRHTPSSNSDGTSKYTLHEADHDGLLDGSRGAKEAASDCTPQQRDGEHDTGPMLGRYCRLRRSVSTPSTR